MKPLSISFRGRLNRRSYVGGLVFWGFVWTVLYIVGIVAMGLDDPELDSEFTFVLISLGAAYAFGFVWFSYAARRLHDMNLSALWLLVTLALAYVPTPEQANPYIGISSLTLLALVPGTPGDNRFGPKAV